MQRLDLTSKDTLLASTSTRVRPSLFLCILCLLCTACASYNQKIARVLESYEAGDFQAAAQKIEDGTLDANFDSETDGILFLLEGAKILQDAGRYDESAALFERASARLEHYDQVADVSVSEEVIATIGTQTSRTYRGTDYDRILLEIYQVFNELGRGDLSEALVRVRRAYRRQAEAVARNRAEIAAREEQEDPTAQAALEGESYQQLEGQVARLTSESYADFVNPMATFLSAILLREEGSHSNSLVDLRKLIQLEPRNTFLAALLEEFEASESPTPGRIYVIFENGRAPERREWSLTLPTPNGLTRFAMPTLSAHPTEVDHLVLRSADGTLDLLTQRVASVDSIVAADFQAHLASMVWRIVISQVAKEIASHAVVRKDESGWGWFATNLFKVISSQADLRTWRTLGAEFQIAYAQRPNDGLLQLSYRTSSELLGASVSVSVPSARTTFVLVRNPRFSPIVPHVFSIGSALVGSPPATSPEVRP